MSEQHTGEAVESSYAVQVGERLRAVRKERRLSLQAVEAASNHEFKASVLGAYERGERAISVLRLQRLASFYGVSADRLLPPAETRLGDEQPAMMIDLRSPVGGDAVAPDDRTIVDLRRLAGATVPERDLLARYCATIQSRRRDDRGPVMAIRADDVRTLAMLLDLPVEAMRKRLADVASPQLVNS